MKAHKILGTTSESPRFEVFLGLFNRSSSRDKDSIALDIYGTGKYPPGS